MNAIQSKPPVVLITGCSSGIGQALADAFHAAGCITYASARRLEALAALQAKGVQPLALDVTDAASVTAAVRAVEASHGAIDILVNNAGIPVMGPTAEIPLALLRQQWETNLTGPMALVQAAVPAMIQRGSGLIVNIGSISGVLTTPFAGPYCASKAALASLNDALRMELKPFGIDVVLVQPGGVQSGLGSGATAQTAQIHWKLYARYAASIARRAGASQVGAMPAPVFAARLVKGLLSPRRRSHFRLGTGSGTLVQLARLPARIKDRVLMKRFGLA